MIPYDHPNLKVFKQHGFIPQGNSGSSQVIGRCPFCGVNKKFFNNPDKKTWDCKICGRSGGYQKFLNQISSVCQKQFTGSDADRLAESRGISVKTLEEFGVGYNKVNHKYIIPVWDASQEELFNIRLYDMKDGILSNSAGCKASLFGLPLTTQQFSSIWLCEGEWDAMAMYEIIKEVGLDDTIVLGVPGANTFRADWAGIFSNKIVHVAFDNDWDKSDSHGVFRPGAGKLGARRVQSMLNGIAKELDFIHWPKEYKDGFDVRDLYIMRQRRPQKTMRNLVSLLNPEPPDIIKADGTKAEEEKDTGHPKLKFDGKGMPPSEVYDNYTKWLELKDVRCIDVIFATIIANRFSNDPVWTFLVGSSSTAKSELIMSLDECPEIMSISSLTPSTLVSGSGGNSGVDPSLVPKLNGLNLAIKDFTTIIQMIESAQNTILSQLRDAYDGNCAKPFGTGAFRKYVSKFGLLAGVTYVIEQFLEGGTALGERFLSYRMAEPTGYEAVSKVMEKVFQNTMNQTKTTMRAELKQTAKEVLSYNFGNDILLTGEIKNKIFALAYWVSKMRGTVLRDSTFKKEIVGRAHIEGPGRLVSQFVSMSMAIALFHRRKEVSDEDFNLVRYIGLSSVPSHLDSIVREFWEEEISSKADVEFNTNDISDILRLPYDTSHRFAENLYQLGILRQRKGKLSPTTWRLDGEIKTVMELGQIYSNQSFKHKRKRS